MKNKYEVKEDHVVIFTKSTEGTQEVLIDKEDLLTLLIENNTWYTRIKKDGTRYVTGGSLGMLHRFLMDPPSDKVVDHINRNTLDNRRSNLRVVTTLVNNRNKGVYATSKTGYPGVNWDNTRGKWKARIRIEGTERQLGRFDNIEDAIQARKEAEEKYWGTNR